MEDEDNLYCSKGDLDFNHLDPGDLEALGDILTNDRNVIIWHTKIVAGDFVGSIAKAMLIYTFKNIILRNPNVDLKDPNTMKKCLYYFLLNNNGKVKAAS